MFIDQKTLDDLSIFHQDGDIFSLINRAVTNIGVQWIKIHCLHPPVDYHELLSVQESVAFWIDSSDLWCHGVSNGTIVMAQKFFSGRDTIVNRPTQISSYIDGMMRKLLRRNEESLMTFSIKHIIDFVNGCNQLVKYHYNNGTPDYLKNILMQMDEYMQHPHIQNIVSSPKGAPTYQLSMLAYNTRRYLKSAIEHLLELFAIMDGIRGLAMATIEHGWQLPTLLPSSDLVLQISGVTHPLIPNAVGYDLDFGQGSNFLFLTGANMSGKSTLIRSIGIAAYLAHLGIGVPANSMKISYIQHLVSNMQVADNIFKGESYFYAEVQRMKHTAERIVAHDYNLVLMDELFKGTNVHDAYECTKGVIEALIQRSNNIYALSTHLYELYESFKDETTIQFYYCATQYTVEQGYEFIYTLRSGVSNDRIGYWVLKKEGVLNILYNNPT